VRVKRFDALWAAVGTGQPKPHAVVEAKDHA
jgi:hypothetical protein